MAYLTKTQKEELFRKTNKNYVFRRFLLFFSLALIVAALAILLYSYFETIIQYTIISNSGKTSPETWIEISHQWWSCIKVIDEESYVVGNAIQITFSITAYVLMGVGGFALLTLLISIILIAAAKSPRKISPMVQALDDDYWKRQIAKINREHALELDAWQEYTELEKLRSGERKEALKRKKRKSPEAKQAKLEKKQNKKKKQEAKKQIKLKKKETKRSNKATKQAQKQAKKQQLENDILKNQKELIKNQKKLIANQKELSDMEKAKTTKTTK